jgi:hypothetical protein
MMGRLDRNQGQFLYCFTLEEVVPEDHLVRAIAAVLDLSWVYGELVPYYSRCGRPSLDPALMMRFDQSGRCAGMFGSTWPTDGSVA